MPTKLRFDGRTAVITGAGGGLGRAYTRFLLAERGAKVVVNDVGRSEGEIDIDSAADVVAEIVSAGGTAIANRDSVATADGGHRIVQAAIETFGRLDIVINNAGILRDGTLHKMRPESFESVVGVHLLGSFYVAQPAFAHMREAGYGRIVNTTSAAGLYGNFGQVNYSSAKMGLVGMVKAIALEGTKRNVKANVIAPLAMSRMTEGLMEDSMKALTPELVAPVVAYLAHEDCPLSGEVLHAHGGHVGRVFIRETLGITVPDLTVEDVADNLEQIMDETGSITPKVAEDAFNLGGAHMERVSR